MRPFGWIDQQQRLPDIISDLLGPQKFDPAFGQFYDSVTLPFIESLLGAPVRCSWLSLFTSGANNHYSTPVHRDNNGMGSPEEQELLDRLSNAAMLFSSAIAC